MRPKLMAIIGFAVLVPHALLCQPMQAQAQKSEAPYPSMAPIDQYLMADRNAEIALARSAAPKAISEQAEVLVFERDGYKSAVKGANEFVCMVQRSWTAPFEDSNFWNPKLRAPICFNAPAARTFLPFIIARTRLALAGKSTKQIEESIEAAAGKKELPAQEVGAMCYMMSKDGYLNDRDGHWHPHLMFFVPFTEAKSWGVGLPGVPVFAFEDRQERLTIFIVPVAKWSDGTPDSHDRT